MLSLPYALFALLSLPVLFGIYFFRTRSVRYEVSALFLWQNRQRSEHGGRKLRRAKLPLLFLMELLILILLSAAAAQPMFRKEYFGSPTAVILDSSYSMTAGFNGDTPQQRAKSGLNTMLENQIAYPVQFITAGDKPQLLAGRAKNAAEARDILAKWHCGSTTADLAEALTFAVNISLPGTKILVITDHLPEGGTSDGITAGKVLWKSFGKALDNAAIIYSKRNFQEGRDRLLLEIANYSAKEQLIRMNILEPERRKILYREEKLISAGENRRIITELPQGTGTVEVRLGEDALAADNLLTVPPSNSEPVRVQIRNVPEELRPKLEKALLASATAKLITEVPELVFTQDTDTADTGTDSNTSSEKNSSGRAWTVRIISPVQQNDNNDNNVKPFIGPFILDSRHPLAAGLNLDGIVWGGNSVLQLNGIPVISAGNIPLLTERTLRDGSVLLTMQLNEKLSTLTSSPAFPVLIWNILKYRSGRRTAEKSVPQSIISAEESDLRKCKTGTSGDWLDEETVANNFVPFAWAFLLGSLVMLGMHQSFLRTASITHNID